jgi:AcrR family transcriptional regulator
VTTATAPRPDPRPRSERARQVIATARDLLEAEGIDGLTMRRLGDELGMRAPSLYKHVAGKPDLELGLIELAMEESGDTLHRAVASRSADPVGALLTAYRAMGLTHPNLYRLLTAGGFPRERLVPGLEAWAGEPFFLAVGEPSLAQALWSFAHGTLILELDHRFLGGSNLDRTWRAGADAFTVARRALVEAPGPGTRTD